MASVIDSMQAAFVGNWTLYSNNVNVYTDRCVGNNYHHSNTVGDGTCKCTWNFAAKPEGIYRFHASWAAHPNRSNNIKYRVYVDGVLKAELSANQQLQLADLIEGGIGFAFLGDVTLPTGVVTVTLTNDANGYAVADGVRLEYLGPSNPNPPPAGDTEEIRQRCLASLAAQRADAHAAVDAEYDKKIIDLNADFQG